MLVSLFLQSLNFNFLLCTTSTKQVKLAGKAEPSCSIFTAGWVFRQGPSCWKCQTMSQWDCRLEWNLRPAHKPHETATTAQCYLSAAVIRLPLRKHWCSTQVGSSLFCAPSPFWGQFKISFKTLLSSSVNGESPSRCELTCCITSCGIWD